MKKLLIITALAAIAATGCKKDNNTPVPAPSQQGSNNNGNPVDSPIAVNDVSNITLDIVRVNTPVAPHNPGNYSIYMEMSQGVIVVGNASNTAVPQYFDKYDIAGNKFINADTTKNLCACGYGSKMVSDRRGNVYYIANDATRYSVASDSWTWLPFPTNVKDNHGESGPIYHDNKIFYIGGRTPTRKVKYLDLATQNWYNTSDFPYATSRTDGVSVDGKLYAFGGDNGTRKFSVYDGASNTWTVKPDLQFNTNFWTDRHYVANIGQYIFVALTDTIHVYDTKADKWSTNPIRVSFNFDTRYMNLFAWNNKLYIGSKSNAGDFQLYTATIKN